MTPEIIHGYQPGAIGRIAELHASFYHRHAGFGLQFESKVASELADFLGRHDEARDRLWLVVADGRIEGSIVIDGIHAGEEGAHLRWFILSDRLRGSGIGNGLVADAVEFCRMRHYRRAYLWTFEGLDAARHLYEKHGFRLALQQRGAQWGSEVNEQRFELRLPALTFRQLNPGIHQVLTSNGEHVGNLKWIAGKWKFKALGLDLDGTVIPGGGPLTDRHNTSFDSLDLDLINATLALP